MIRSGWVRLALRARHGWSAVAGLLLLASVSSAAGTFTVFGQKVYTLQGHEEDLNKMAGQRATVKGSVSRDTVTVSSVTAAKRWATT